MTKMTPRLKLAVLRSKLPDKALISAIENAARASDPPDEAAPPQEIATTSAKKRQYRRRDLQAES